MRTEQEVCYARRKLTNALTVPGLSDQQKTLLMGMSAALQWTCHEGDTLQRLLDGEPLDAGKTMPVPDFKAIMEDE